MCSCVAAKCFSKYVVLPAPCMPTKIIASATALTSVDAHHVELRLEQEHTTVRCRSGHNATLGRRGSYRRAQQILPGKQAGRRKLPGADSYIWRLRCCPTTHICSLSPRVHRATLPIVTAALDRPHSSRLLESLRLRAVARQ